MPRLFDNDLNRLRERLLAMGAMAERMIHHTVETVVKHDLNLFQPVRELEEKMDALQREIDEETIRLIGVYTPVASDLRLLLMTTRINAELERIGDQAMNIGFYTKNLLKEEPLKSVAGLPAMGETTQAMLRNALDAFTQRSDELALDVIKTDDRVDHMNDQIFRELLTYVLSDPQVISRVIELVLIARAIERIADHAVSIAQDVVYMVRGEDIRHVRIE